MQAYVIPRPLGDGTSALVRQPDRNWAALPASGRWVHLDEYWARRLRDADVVEASPPEQEDEGDGIEKTPVAAERQPDGSFAGTLEIGREIPPAERDPAGNLIAHPIDVTDAERAALPPLDPPPSLETSEPTGSRRRGK